MYPEGIVWSPIANGAPASALQPSGSGCPSFSRPSSSTHWPRVTEQPEIRPTIRSLMAPLPADAMGGTPSDIARQANLSNEIPVMTRVMPIQPRLVSLCLKSTNPASAVRTIPAPPQRA